MYGVTFNGKHSYKHFGITMPPEREIGFPSKEKILVKVPFSNAEYDFSELYGSQAFGPRTLKYSFNVFNRNYYTKETMNIQKTVIINWLMNSKGKQKLYDDAIPGYYFLVEVESEASFEEDWETGTLTVTFKAYPFMIAELEEGHDLWEEINFELDVLQPIEFIVNGSVTVDLLNNGTPNVSPKIKSTAPMSIVMNDVIYNIPTGELDSNDFVLYSGKNSLIINGNGTISFHFYKELI
ncbi:phage tail protein [Bacillus sp. CH30_1T]|uniref:phage tail family protein n=1 Tax=Bacillus sp. CH30_1T TaxID=2604836 RepID=UPI0011EDFA1A|nr:phage tail family protein [Bacillus sp. CH30_1T]KAA0563675.1 phage tail protein [Bacillus sp. CH30_1T]